MTRNRGRRLICTCHGQSVPFLHNEAKNKLLFRLVFPLGSAVVPFYSNQPPSGLVVSPLLSTSLHVLIRNGVPNIIFQAITVFADQTEGLVSSPSMTRCPPFLQGLVFFLPSLRHHDGLVRIARVAAAGYTGRTIFYLVLFLMDSRTLTGTPRDYSATEFILWNLRIFEFPLFKVLTSVILLTYGLSDLPSWSD